MALLLCLALTAALARGCLHCHGNFSEKFSFYRHHVNLKSWWVGDIPVSGSLLTDWSQDTMKELHLAIPAEISECGAPPGSTPGPVRPRPAHTPPPDVPSLGEAEPSGERRVPEDGSTVPGEAVFPWVFSQRAASYLPGAGAPHPESHHRKPHRLSASLRSSAEWEAAVQGLLQHINNWSKQNTNTSLISPSFRCLEPPHLANLTLENASECLMQH
ncbi:izumo sperm-egg fusion protein 4 isoform X2 [Delphinapterus leucas]|uniref:Izumo sperm-egg fusion protein 4 isoform X2 n=1 Tax=Delphinapterus leucas TaxID=9749 RepID=A0A2Y9LV13_DELLE|nr:izumo sperm-egg fusion protein 4 isoform X2 [Delphinapterus leucas]